MNEYYSVYFQGMMIRPATSSDLNRQEKNYSVIGLFSATTDLLVSFFAPSIHPVILFENSAHFGSRNNLSITH